MFLQRRLDNVQNIYREYPQTFWILTGAAFIDRLGGALLFPFFALYVTKKFGVGMTEVGVLFGIFSLTSIFSGMLGGAMADRFGRKGMVLFGLVASALSSLVLGVIDVFTFFFGVAAFVGLFADVGHPAQQAMVADLLPEEKHASGYGIQRIAMNLAVTIGPALGGLLATYSYLLLFLADAVTSLITAAIVFFVIPETKPERVGDEEEESVTQTLRGYGTVLRDGAFMGFIVASLLMTIVYMQMNSTLGVYLRDVHAVPEQGYGYILSMNAAMVVLFQFAITRRVEKYKPLLVMVAGSLLYAVGFGMYGFVSAYWLFLVAMAVITVGEMIVIPVAQAIVARLAPSHMRGRYMAMYGFSWVIPGAVGPLLAGLVMDNIDPNWVWYGSAILGVLAAGGFLLLRRQTERANAEAREREQAQAPAEAVV